VSFCDFLFAVLENASDTADAAGDLGVDRRKDRFANGRNTSTRQEQDGIICCGYRNLAGDNPNSSADEATIRQRKGDEPFFCS